VAHFRLHPEEVPVEPTRWQRLEELFHRALALDAGQRDAFLAAECGGDEELRREVERLLAMPDSGGESLGGAVAEAAREVLAGGDLAEAGSEIGPYRILRHLASGGMGEVYLAEQEQPVQRRVALKTIKRGMDTSEILRRFESERHALSRMHHPNVARVLDAGRTPDGRPYFAMDYVAGPSITDYCDRARLPLDDRLRLMLDVCAGVQHAHQQGILHRDLKPSNVLVEEVDGHPVPRIIDFGIAKAIGESEAPATQVTERGRVLGTPVYMSPEQAGLGDGGGDTRSDVYSLGVLLYELLVGTPPLDVHASGADSGETLRRIREEEPRKPSARLRADTESSGAIAEARRSTATALERRLRGELDWIVLKALEKEPNRRYRTPAELASDLARYFTNDPIEARPPSRSYRARKFVRRHRAAVVAASLVTVALVAGIVGTSIALLRARRAEAHAHAEALASDAVASFMRNTLLEMDPSRSRGQPPQVRDILSRATARMRSELRDQPRMRARVLGAAGDVYRGLGVYDSARTLLVEEMALVEQLGAGDGLEMAAALERLGSLQRDTGSFDSARTALRRELEIREAQPEPDRYQVANTLRSISTVEIMAGRFADAQPLIERELSLREHLEPRDEALILSTLGNLSLTYLQQGDYVRARGPMQALLTSFESQPGPPSGDLGRAYVNFGSLLLGSDVADTAATMFEKALAIFEPLVGPHHFATAHTYLSLAQAKLAMHDALAAEKWGLRARESFAAISSPGAGEVAVVDGVLGEAYGQQGRFPEAIATFERGVRGLERAYGPSDARLGNTLVAYATCLADMGDRGAGARTARRAADILASSLPADHPDLLKAQSLARELGSEAQGR